MSESEKLVPEKEGAHRVKPLGLLGRESLDQRVPVSLQQACVSASACACSP